MDVKNLETFVMVNELKSFTLAAGRLGYTQSTVSFQIKQLEILDIIGIWYFGKISRVKRIFLRYSLVVGDLGR